jgi:flavin reductase (DIM6/NTAB) family NADH-FMN oxidoreductase RutF
MSTTTFDQRSFRNALGCYATGVAVITTKTASGCDAGVTVNSFASLSLDPPLILFSIARTANILAALQDSPAFGVNILCESQRALSTMFAKPSTADFTKCGFHRGESGVALFDDALATLECRNAQQIDGGDHVIFVGHVDRFAVAAERDPLLFYRGAYGTCARDIPLSAHAPSGECAQACA